MALGRRKAGKRRARVSHKRNLVSIEHPARVGIDLGREVVLLALAEDEDALGDAFREEGEYGSYGPGHAAR